MRHPWRSVALLPAMRIFLFLAAGILLQWHAPCGEHVLRVAAVTVLALSIILLLAERRQPLLQLPRDVTLTLLLLLCGMLLCAHALASFPLDLLPYADLKEKVQLRGTVVSNPRVADDRQRCTVEASQVIVGTDTVRVAGRVLLSYNLSRYDDRDTLVPLRIGDIIQARCRLRTPRPPRNPHAFDARSWVLQEGALLQASVSKGGDVHRHDAGHASWWRLRIAALLVALRDGITCLYRPRHAAVMSGLLLGDRSGIDEDTFDDFRRSGIMHILAVSGLHAGIVLMMAFVPLERLRFPLRAAAALSFLWTFAAVTGFAPPVTRATLMATLFLGGVLLQRAGSSINALAVAGVIITVIDPLAILGLSFQLSFGAVLGILLFHDRIQCSLTALLPRRLRGKAAGAVLALVALTISAQSLTLPMLAMNFGQLSASGLLTNVIAVPLVFVVVCCGILSVLIFPLWVTAAKLFAATAAAALDLIIIVSNHLAAVPGAVIDLPALPSAAMILYVSAIAYLSATPGRMRQKLVLLTLFILTAIVTGSALTPSALPRLRVTFLDVGQGDATLIEIPGSDPWLIDTGPGGAHGNSGTQTIIPYLRANGIGRLAAMVITHPDDDHRGGAAAVLEGIRVDSVYISCSWPTEGEAGTLLALMRTRTRGVRDVRAGERFTPGGQARLYVLSPPADGDCVPSNENSVVIMLVYGKTRFLFTGDADVAAERRMIARYDTFLRADVLKVGHHGSTTSTSPGFAVKVKPKHAVICVGRNNQFNHPRQEVLNRLRLVGARIYRTDIDGAVIFESDGHRVSRLRWSK
ncbi:MAG: DNA internalization-related competence protein ComEC/Rec2 [Bacteroidetes bacterium]|nr:DNA internalization-related competence protein ComEC/Rec2 [Bacteroidota bacterium]